MKYITDLNIRTETIKLLGENIEKKLLYIGLGKDFLTPKAQAQTQKLISGTKLKSICTAEEIVKKMTRQTEEGRKYLQITYLKSG